VSAGRKPAAERGPRAHRRRRGRPHDPFEIEVRECARELALIHPLLLEHFWAAALAAALAIQAVRALAQCVREGTMTSAQARELIEHMVELKLPDLTGSRST